MDSHLEMMVVDVVVDVVVQKLMLSDYRIVDVVEV